MMVNTVKTLLVLAVVFYSANAYPEKIRLAVLDFNGNGVSKAATSAATDIVRTLVVNSGLIKVIERSRINEILKEQGLQISGCVDSSCAVTIGKLVSVHKILIGALSKTRAGYSISARVVDVGSGSIDFAERESFTKDKDITMAARILATKLLNRIASNYKLLSSKTYESREDRNRLSISGGYRYGWIKGIKLPKTFKTYSSKEVDGNIKTILITPGYELTNFITIKSNLKYYKIEHDEFYYIRDSEGGVGPNSAEYRWTNGLVSDWTFKGYGLTANIQFNYPLGGFIPFVSAGIGFSRFSCNDDQDLDSLRYKVYYYDGTASQTGRIEENYVYQYKTEFNVFGAELELGVSIFVSRFVEIVLLGGFEFPIGASLYNDVKLKRVSRVEEGDISNIPAQRRTMNEVDSSGFEGNFPYFYFIQAGVNFRVF